jgi:uncharacterized protein (DUF1684 family)
MNRWLTVILVAATCSARGQSGYLDSLTSFQKDYVATHQVVKGDDTQFFRFYPVDEQYRVTADFKRTLNSNWFPMETSGTTKKTFRVFGVLQFSVHDTLVKLRVYQSQALMNSDEYEDHLFLPFTDLTSGEETYEAGRYIDLKTGDIVNDKVIIDFNKAYNPYCAYVDGKYNCPIPPRENQLEVSIMAGEMSFAKPRQNE